MADPRFFKVSAPISLGELAALSGAALGEKADTDLVVRDVAPLDIAGAGQVSFLDNVKYKGQFEKTGATACFVAPDLAHLAPEACHVLLSQTPYKSYALAAQYFYPEAKPESTIVPGAVIAPDAQIGANCTIEAGVVIGAGAMINQDCWIEAGAVIGPAVEIGQGSRIGTNASISHALIGDHVRLYPGVCVGQDGFGFAIDPQGHVKVPQLGRVIIEDGVQVGANTTIDRGAGPDTVIGAGTWIDNLVQIGHNVKIGKGCVIVAQVGISGSTVLEDFVVMGGQSGVAGHLKIGMGARIGAQSGVMRDVPAGEEQMGSPAMPGKRFMRQVALLNRLIKTGQNS